jgi:DNA recombination protein RmuC
MSIEIFIILVSLIAVGTLAALFVFSLKNQKKITLLKNEFQKKDKETEFLRFETEKKALVWEDRYNSLKSEVDGWKEELQKKREENTHLVGRSKKPKPNT